MMNFGGTEDLSASLQPDEACSAVLRAAVEADDLQSVKGRHDLRDISFALPDVDDRRACGDRSSGSIPVGPQRVIRRVETTLSDSLGA